MKVSREIIDHVFSFVPTLARGGFLSSLNLEPLESDRQQMLLWSTIFKDDKWLAEVTEKDTAKLVLIGSQLSQVSSSEKKRERKDIFMTLCLLGGTGKIPNWELFESSLNEHTYDHSLDEIRFVSGIKLNVQNLSEPFLSILRKNPEQRQTPIVIISHEGISKIISFGKRKSYVQYSFYGGARIRDLSDSGMQTIGKSGWVLELHDNGDKWTVILSPIFYALRHLLRV